MNDLITFTFQTRLKLNQEQCLILDNYAKLYGRVERCLFAAMSRQDFSRAPVGILTNELKRTFQTRFGLLSRQLNSIRIGLEGKINSIKARQTELISEAEQRANKAVKLSHSWKRNRQPANPINYTRKNDA